MRQSVELPLRACGKRGAARDVFPWGPTQISRVVLLFLCCHPALVLATDGSLSYEEVLQGLLMRDSLVRSVTISFRTTSAFPDKTVGAIPKKFRYVYRDDLIYMHMEKPEGPRTYVTDAALTGGEQYISLDHGGKSAFLGRYIPPWANVTHIEAFFRLGLQDIGEPLMGEWFRRKGGEIVGTAKTDGHDAYIVSDKGRENPPPPNGEGYLVWVCPDYGFAPVRIYEYRHGALHHLYEFSDFAESANSGWTPAQAHVWYFDVSKKIERFDPAKPTSNWLARVDVVIEELVYNKQEYPDSFFDIEIPSGYEVSDSSVGFWYTKGGPISDPAIQAYVDNVKTVTRREDSGGDTVTTSALRRSGEEPDRRGKDTAPSAAQPPGRSALLRNLGFGAALIVAFLFGFLFHRVRFAKR